MIQSRYEEINEEGSHICSICKGVLVPQWSSLYEMLCLKCLLCGREFYSLPSEERAR